VPPHVAGPRGIETLAALRVARLAAVYVFQARWMAPNKARLAPVAAHLAIVRAARFVAVGWSSAIAITAFWRRCIWRRT